MGHPPAYHAYMLRIWRDATPHTPTNECWRFSLEDPHTGERIGFVSVHQLGEYLLAQLMQSQEPVNDSPDAQDRE